QERLKELGVLHSAARLLQQQRPTRELLEDLVRLMTGGWQYPSDCQARIAYGGIEVATPHWRETPWKQAARFATSEGPGSIEVVYTEERPQAGEGPFVVEERALLESLAEMLVSHLELRKHQQGLEDLVATRTVE